MATVFYDKAAVKVSFGGINETLLASNCSINFASPSQPMYAIGSKGSLGQFPAGARAGDMSFGFLTTITGIHLKVGISFKARAHSHPTRRPAQNYSIEPFSAE